MKFSRPSRRPAAAFTMIEIAMSLAVIGFALVAIIGVLPQGMDVQKDNRRETIINQDANYLLQAIRSGTTSGFNDLTNYVMSVTNFWTLYSPATNRLKNGMDTYTNNNATGFSVTSVPTLPWFALTNGAHLIGLLSTPAYMPMPGGSFQSNYVVVYMRAMSGEAAEKYPQTNSLIQDSAFGYRLISQVVPWNSIATYVSPQETNFADPGLNPSYANPTPGSGLTTFSAAANDLVTNWAQSLTTNGNLNITNFMIYTNALGVVIDLSTNTLFNNDNNVNNDLPMFMDRARAWLVDSTRANNLYDVRLLFRWLLLPNGQVGNGRQIYRMMVGGTLTNQNASTVTNISNGTVTTNFTPFWYFQAGSYSALGANSL